MAHHLQASKLMESLYMPVAFIHICLFSLFPVSLSLKVCVNLQRGSSSTAHPGYWSSFYSV